MLRDGWQIMQKSHSAILSARSNHCYGGFAASYVLNGSALTLQQVVASVMVSDIRGEGKPTTPPGSIRSQVSVKYRERGKAKRC